LAELSGSNPEEASPKHYLKRDAKANNYARKNFVKVIVFHY
jgi:hypothetical protein